MNATAQAVGVSPAHLDTPRPMKPPKAAPPRPETVHRRDDEAPAPPRAPAEHGLSSVPVRPTLRVRATDGAKEKHPRQAATHSGRGRPNFTHHSLKIDTS